MVLVSESGADLICCLQIQGDLGLVISGFYVTLVIQTDHLFPDGLLTVVSMEKILSIYIVYLVMQ